MLLDCGRPSASADGLGASWMDVAMTDNTELTGCLEVRQNVKTNDS